MCQIWCNRWTTHDPKCAGCTDCGEKACYHPSLFAHGFEGSDNAGFDAALGSVSVESVGRLALSGNTRAYLVKDVKRQGSEYLHLNLLGKTLRFTVDVSRVPCSTIAAFYVCPLWTVIAPLTLIITCVHAALVPYRPCLLHPCV